MTRGKTLEVWIGTRKGAFVFRTRDRKKWDSEGPFFGGQEVHHVAQDRRDPKRLYAAAGNAWFGYHLYASTDAGATWNVSENGLTMASMNEQMKGETAPGFSIARLWHVAPGAPDEPGVVYLGADPGALFRSTDNGANWEIVEGLTQHATRDKWSPGAGGLMVHSIQPLGKGRVIVGISAAGAFRTSDSGKTWEPFNGKVLCEFRPDKFPEVGQCVHKLLAHPRKRSDLYQQNHCGVYRAKFTADNWQDISAGLPTRFGFALAVPAAEDQTLFTIPIASAAERFVPKGKLRVARSRDGGKNWQFMTKGLPQENAYALVHREAMSSDDYDSAGVYFGTTGGSVFYTRNGGNAWQPLAEHLPPVYSVSTAVRE
jgi:photosystem II stability/assembly factor-like uncharacterized protein